MGRSADWTSGGRYVARTHNFLGGGRERHTALAKLGAYESALTKYVCVAVVVLLCIGGF